MADEIQWTPEPWTEQAAEIAKAYLGNPSNTVSPDDVHKVIADIYLAVVSNFMFPKREQEDAPRPAVPVEDSIGDDFLICLEDGVKLKMLKRYLRSQHDMSPEEYRAKWDLPADYPMVAPDYSSKRSALAKKQGLGRKAAPVLKMRGRA